MGDGTSQGLQRALVEYFNGIQSAGLKGKGMNQEKRQHNSMKNGTDCGTRRIHEKKMEKEINLGPNPGGILRNCENRGGKKKKEENDSL